VNHKGPSAKKPLIREGKARAFRGGQSWGKTELPKRKRGALKTGSRQKPKIGQKHQKQQYGPDRGTFAWIGIIVSRQNKKKKSHQRRKGYMMQKLARGAV